MVSDVDTTGPTVRVGDWLHFHCCPTCRHSWSCTSSTCLAMRGWIKPGQRQVPAGIHQMRIEDVCRRHR